MPVKQIILSLFLILISNASIATAIVPPSIEAGFVNQSNVSSPLGSNLAQVVDYAAEYPFVNYFRMARPWFSAPADGSAFQDGQPLALDSNGNVASLAVGQFARTILFTGLPVDPGLAGKKLHLFYDGDGDLSYAHVTVISKASGHDVIQLRNIVGIDEDLNATITLTRSNPNNPLRNIRLLPPGGICAGNPLSAVTESAACANNDFKSFRTFHQRILFNP